ncbi:glycoside hydrolase family 16 protein [Hymenobacter sp. 5516J-16]|uniref:glycoside hydrolase family 16 protein n=1 Tax=Hymenobacter sp. 5516J-16 TaxID=2932253 RepID=UPI001FD467C6|nr:glycoside hydrolase family 16 protein [Hymenobacter sp. 5516J-16]UOQ76241.1 glycoside hydrolase family 16 protein [Hymenobacter sp. 5516J-16]
MKHRFTSLLGAAALCVLGSAPSHAQTYQQVWADEFTNGISSSWVFETGGGGWGNNEKQYYQRANTTVVNGILQITARKETVGGMPYTSSRMKTQGLKEFKYGKIEARMKLPLGQGLWPAFWMLGANINTVSWPACGEIDVMEHINAENKVYGTVHWDNNGHAEYGGNIITTPQDYHTYSIEWEPTYIRWFVDGVKYHEINITNSTGGTEEFQRPFFLLLNLAVAGNWPGQTVDESKLPATMFVDYVRVYQKSGTTTPPPTTSSTTIQAESYSSMNGVQLETTTDAGGARTCPTLMPATGWPTTPSTSQPPGPIPLSTAWLAPAAALFLLI